MYLYICGDNAHHHTPLDSILRVLIQEEDRFGQITGERVELLDMRWAIRITIPNDKLGESTARQFGELIWLIGCLRGDATLTYFRTSAIELTSFWDESPATVHANSGLFSGIPCSVAVESRENWRYEFIIYMSWTSGLLRTSYGDAFEGIKTPESCAARSIFEALAAVTGTPGKWLVRLSFERPWIAAIPAPGARFASVN